MIHAGDSVAFGRVDIRGDRGRIEAWLGGADLPVSVTQGSPAVTDLVLTIDGREVVLGAIDD